MWLTRHCRVTNIHRISASVTFAYPSISCQRVNFLCLRAVHDTHDRFHHYSQVLFSKGLLFVEPDLLMFLLCPMYSHMQLLSSFLECNSRCDYIYLFMCDILSMSVPQTVKHQITVNIFISYSEPSQFQTN